ncbi:hypothetical protein MSG28_000684 [Choristoneura fumiferana]|uniref:Uncharacterized protein n=1 Tax=Choristoneura fumiferana TaxID=7141 RepID=A0ACC0K1S9_CHOFU|nr:hypothetical protein MSG28_000684 [Choristoneura fumiferana]
MQAIQAIRAMEAVNLLPQPRRRKVYNQRANPIEDLPDIEFRRRYRFDKETVQFIIQLVRADLTKDRRGASLTPELQVLTAIRCWGRKEVQDDAAELHGLSQPTVTCDADLKIQDIVARWRGSTHDARIFNECSLKERFEAGEFRGKRLLGDSGYKLEPYLLTPVLRAQSASEERYNTAHIATRNTVERCFGVWKARFRCLLQGMTVKLQNVKTTVIALAVLHNIAIMHNDLVPEADEDGADEEEADEEVVVAAVSRAANNAHLRAFIHRHFQ